jgi:hypothetical protein
MLAFTMRAFERTWLRRSFVFGFVALAGVTFGQAPATAVTTTASVTIGGPGALGCTTPAIDPPTLPNGTPASGQCDFSFNAVTQMLTLTVSNTSPIVPGQVNPVIREILLNLPALGVTGATLVSQSSQGDAPAFTLSVDPDLSDGVGDIPGGCFGRFGIRLSDPGTIAGSIKNPAAPIQPGPSGYFVIGPAVFILHIQGSSMGSASFLASTFASSISLAADSEGSQANVAFKFATLTEQGFIGNAPVANGGSAAGWVVGTPAAGQSVTVVAAGHPGWSGSLIVSLNPGPTEFQSHLYPIGTPYFVLLTATMPLEGWVSLLLTIPGGPHPEIVTVPFYAIVFLTDPGHKAISVSEQFSLAVDF